MPEINYNTIPAFSPNWLGNTGAPAPAPTPTQAPPPEQGLLSNVGADDIFDAGKAGYDWLSSSSGTPVAAFAGGGAPTGAISATGGSYTTGAGLAGTASPINTTAGAAGQTAGMSGMAVAGSALVAGFLGDKIFGGYGGGGAAIGATVGSALGPIGTVLGGIAGGAIGGLFGSDGPSKSYYGVGTTQTLGTAKGVTSKELALGNIAVQGRRGAADAVQPTIDAFTQMDDAVAEMLTPEQLSSVQASIAKYGVTARTTSTRTHFGLFEDVLSDAFKTRYATAIAGIDPEWRDVYMRTATDENQAGLFSTAVTMDNEYRAGTGIFAGSDPNGGAIQAIDIAGQNYGIEKPALTGNTANDARTLATYETAVLEAYAQEGQSKMVDVTKEAESTDNVKPSYDSSITDKWRGGVVSHPAEPKPANDATDANILKQGLF